MSSSYILSPAMLGILGGGQLASMFTIAAKQLGYSVTVLDPDPDAPAGKLADVHLCTTYDNQHALQILAQCAAVTTEFENVSAASMQWLAQYTNVFPSGECVAVAQDRETEKAWIGKSGLSTVPYAMICSIEDLRGDFNALLPGILKTATLGYDGKGQITVCTQDELVEAFFQLQQVRCILEKKVELKAEISVVVARQTDGQSRCFPVAENIHQNGILAYTLVPARLSVALQSQAKKMAQQLAEAMNYVGVMAVEMFVVGTNEELVVNEIAPRPHNSGHYTLDACLSNQFEQQVRLMCGFAPAATDLLSPCCMVNILGNVWPAKGQPDWSVILNDRTSKLHLYGKKVARHGRKMGHFTVLADDSTLALVKARTLCEQLMQYTDEANL